MSNLELLNRAATSATCQMLGAAGSTLVGAGAVSLWAGGTGFVPITAGGLSLLAANYLCPEMDVGGTEPPPGVNGCIEVDGYGVIEINVDGTWAEAFGPGSNEYQTGRTAVEITQQYVYYVNAINKWISFIEWRFVGGITSSTQARFATEEAALAAAWRINPLEGDCIRDPSDPLPIPPAAEQPITYVDNVTNCTYNVTLQGFGQISEAGDVQPVYLIEGQELLRSDGGRMGGCHFPPTIYMPPGGNGGGGGYYLPLPDGGAPPGPGGGLPWWAGPLAGLVAGVVIDQIIEDLVNALQPPMSSGSFTFIAPCNKDEAGNPLTRTWEFPEETYNSRLLTHQVALMEIMQQHLDWKTPICDEHPLPEGEFRTISFRSVDTSPYGKSRLRKRFRYRAVSGNDLSDVVDHWKDFSFEAGPYRVRWVGGTWRSPEIWAATEAEGQRVIEHAAVEAGVSPLEGGRWSTRLSGSSRQGVPGTMKIDTTGGYYWITARDGSSERPLVALT